LVYLPRRIDLCMRWTRLFVNTRSAMVFSYSCSAPGVKTLIFLIFKVSSINNEPNYTARSNHTVHGDHNSNKSTSTVVLDRPRVRAQAQPLPPVSKLSGNVRPKSEVTRGFCLPTTTPAARYSRPQNRRSRWVLHCYPLQADNRQYRNITLPQ
jgi:hypothetical protein